MVLLLDETSTRKKKPFSSNNSKSGKRIKRFFGAVPKVLCSKEHAEDDLRIIKKKSENVCLVC